MCLLQSLYSWLPHHQRLSSWHWFLFPHPFTPFYQTHHFTALARRSQEPLVLPLVGLSKDMNLSELSLSNPHVLSYVDQLQPHVWRRKAAKDQG